MIPENVDFRQGVSDVRYLALLVVLSIGVLNPIAFPHSVHAEKVPVKWCSTGFGSPAELSSYTVKPFGWLLKIIGKPDEWFDSEADELTSAKIVVWVEGVAEPQKHVWIIRTEYSGPASILINRSCQRSVQGQLRIHCSWSGPRRGRRSIGHFLAAFVASASISGSPAAQPRVWLSYAKSAWSLMWYHDPSRARMHDIDMNSRILAPLLVTIWTLIAAGPEKTHLCCELNNTRSFCICRWICIEVKRFALGVCTGRLMASDVEGCIDLQWASVGSLQIRQP